MSDIIYGRNAVSEAFKFGKSIEKVFMLHSIRGEFEVQIRRACKEQNIPLAKVPEVKLNDLAGQHAGHQGIVAIIPAITYVDYATVIRLALASDRAPLLVIVDGVTDVRNLGAIARSAYFFGAHGMIITGNASGRINEDAIKASAGALLQLPVARASSIFQLISDLQAAGVIVAATSLTQAVSVHTCDMKEPLAIVLGSEGKGLNNKVLEIVDYTLQIPAVNVFDSLNVSVAAGIMLYEASRQRTAPSTKKS